MPPAPPPPDPDVPLRIHADRATGRLEIEWADGHRTVYDALSLRWLCPCAYCRGEAGLPGWLDSAPTLAPEQTRIVNVALVGNYALQPTWGDGHETGFYTFGLLREHCPCDVCLSRRTSAGHGRAGPIAHSHEGG